MGHVLVKWDAPTHTTFLLGFFFGVHKKYLGVSQAIYEHMYSDTGWDKVGPPLTQVPLIYYIRLEDFKQKLKGRRELRI
jgi:hypothetical protein